jgi:hypothetical protein
MGETYIFPDWLKLEDIVSNMKNIISNHYQDYEVCGIMERHTQDANYYKVLLTNMGSPRTENERASCNYSYYSTIIWHTHPKIGKYYPSMEDIRKVLRNKTIKASFIFTVYGAWLLQCTRDNDVPKDVEIEIHRILNSFYFHSQTEKGKTYSYEAINELCDNLNNYLINYDFSIQFLH